MLPVKYRIKKELLPIILKQNKAFPSVCFTLRVHYRGLGEPNFGVSARVAVIISNKVSPLSVKRHLVKRRIHAILASVWPQITPNIDLLIQVNKEALGLNFGELEKQLLDNLKTAKVWK